MKKPVVVAVVIAAALVALFFYQRSRNEYDLRLLKAVPEIDATAIKDIIHFNNAEISSEKFHIVVTGTARIDLGLSLPVLVDRLQDGAKVDTVSAYIHLNSKPKLPEGYVIQEGQGGPPPFDYRIGPGDPVRIDIDATIKAGRFTKLVIRPDPEHPGPAITP